jgi:hypothetical protein
LVTSESLSLRSRCNHFEHCPVHGEQWSATDFAGCRVWGHNPPPDARYSLCSAPCRDANVSFNTLAGGLLPATQPTRIHHIEQSDLRPNATCDGR